MDDGDQGLAHPESRGDVRSQGLGRHAHPSHVGPALLLDGRKDLLHHGDGDGETKVLAARDDDGIDPHHLALAVEERYLAWYEAINHAFEQGAETLNMGGLENSLAASDGLLKFKKHFNPTIEAYVGEFNIPVNSFLYKLSDLAYKLRKKMR